MSEREGRGTQTQTGTQRDGEIYWFQQEDCERRRRQKERKKTDEHKPVDRETEEIAKHSRKNKNINKAKRIDNND